MHCEMPVIYISVGLVISRIKANKYESRKMKVVREPGLSLNPLPPLPRHPFPVLTAVVGGLIRAWI